MVTEAAEPGWTLQSIVCRNGNGTELNGYSVNLAQGRVTLDAVPDVGDGGRRAHHLHLHQRPRRASLTLVKTVVNDNGGTAVAADFQATIDGTDVAWDTAVDLPAGSACRRGDRPAGLRRGQLGRRLRRGRQHHAGSRSGCHVHHHQRRCGSQPHPRQDRRQRQRRHGHPDRLHPHRGRAHAHQRGRWSDVGRDLRGGHLCALRDDPARLRGWRLGLRRRRAARCREHRHRPRRGRHLHDRQRRPAGRALPGQERRQRQRWHRHGG